MKILINPCPAEPRFILFDKTVDPDELASDAVDLKDKNWGEMESIKYSA